MKLTTACLECLLRRHLKTARALGDEDTAMAFARELLKIMASGPEQASSPYYGPQITELFQRFYNLSPDRFQAEKRASNDFVLKRMDSIRAVVKEAVDPVYGALQCAVLGNYLDFSALQDRVDFDELDGLLAKSQEIALDKQVYAALLADLAGAKRLLYVTDNAGEIGFDRILAEELAKAYPALEITFCVRGGPALNDATREDAAAVGIPFPVIDNGSTIAGTELNHIGAQARQAVEQADVILAKGQGNVETMLGCGYNVYYVFLVKCQKFMEEFSQPMLTPMLVRERDAFKREATG